MEKTLRRSMVFLPFVNFLLPIRQCWVFKTDRASVKKIRNFRAPAFLRMNVFSIPTESFAFDLAEYSIAWVCMVRVFRRSFLN
jgi:hypothetical protein